MSINKIKIPRKLKLVLLPDGSFIYSQVFSYKSLNRFEADSSNTSPKN